jgi:hypothetical protein
MGMVHVHPRMLSRLQREALAHSNPYQEIQPFGYLTTLPRAYKNTRRQDGTLAGLLIGTIAGVVAAVMLGSQIF